MTPRRMRISVQSRVFAIADVLQRGASSADRRGASAAAARTIHSTAFSSCWPGPRAQWAQQSGMASGTAARSIMWHQDDRLGHSMLRAAGADENIDDDT